MATPAAAVDDDKVEDTLEATQETQEALEEIARGSTDHITVATANTEHDQVLNKKEQSTLQDEVAAKFAAEYAAEYAAKFAS